MDIFSREYEGEHDIALSPTLCMPRLLRHVAPAFRGGDVFRATIAAGYTYTRPHESGVQLMPVDDLPGQSGDSDTSFALVEYALFGAKGEEAELDRVAHRNIARLDQEPELLPQLVARYGPLAPVGHQFAFGVCPLEVFLQQNAIKYHPGNDSLLQTLKEQPYYKAWAKGQLRGSCGEPAEFWRALANQMSELLGMLKMIRDEDADLLANSILKSKYVAGSTTSQPIMEDFKLMTPKHLFERTRRWMLNVASLRVTDGFDVHYGLDGMRLRPKSLRAAMWSQFAREVMGQSETFQCEGCGWWFEALGKARGRNKKTCSESCKVRASQKRKAKRIART